MFFYKIYTISKYAKAVTATLLLISCPAGVLQWAYVAFRMRHEAEDAARGVAYAGDILHGTVRIGRISGHLALLINILEDYHAFVPQAVERLTIFRYELAFPMRHR